MNKPKLPVHWKQAGRGSAQHCLNNLVLSIDARYRAVCRARKKGAEVLDGCCSGRSAERALQLGLFKSCGAVVQKGEPA